MVVLRLTLADLSESNCWTPEWTGSGDRQTRITGIRGDKRRVGIVEPYVLKGPKEVRLRPDLQSDSRYDLN